MSMGRGEAYRRSGVWDIRQVVPCIGQKLDDDEDYAAIRVLAPAYIRRRFRTVSVLTQAKQLWKGEGESTHERNAIGVRTPLSNTMAATRTMPIDAKYTIVATTRMGLNIYQIHSAESISVGV